MKVVSVIMTIDFNLNGNRSCVQHHRKHLSIMDRSSVFKILSKCPFMLCQIMLCSSIMADYAANFAILETRVFFWRISARSQ